MAIPVERRDGSGYGVERAKERPSEEPLCDVDLVGVGAE
jgi:hypothetical protein